MHHRFSQGLCHKGAIICTQIFCLNRNMSIKCISNHSFKRAIILIILQFGRNLITKIPPKVLSKEFGVISICNDLGPFFSISTFKYCNYHGMEVRQPCMNCYCILETSFSVHQNEINTSWAVRLKTGWALDQVR